MSVELQNSLGIAAIALAILLGMAAVAWASRR